MKGKEELEIIISDEGEVRVLVRGIKGPACIKEVENFARKIGVIKEMTRTSEFYQQAEAGIQVKQSGRKKD